MEEQPKIYHEKKEYWQIACKKCQNDSWKIGSDGEVFVAMCSHCCHTVPLFKKQLQPEPDPKPIELRFFS